MVWYSERRWDDWFGWKAGELLVLVPDGVAGMLLPVEVVDGGVQWWKNSPGPPGEADGWSVVDWVCESGCSCCPMDCVEPLAGVWGCTSTVLRRDSPVDVDGRGVDEDATADLENVCDGRECSG